MRLECLPLLERYHLGSLPPFEPLGELVKLTVVHDGFEPGSAILPGISEGWPRILSDLKTLLETSDTLPVG